jgi:hypothetical protein
VISHVFGVHNSLRYPEDKPSGSLCQDPNAAAQPLTPTQMNAVKAELAAMGVNPVDVDLTSNIGQVLNNVAQFLIQSGIDPAAVGGGTQPQQGAQLKGEAEPPVNTALLDLTQEPLTQAQLLTTGTNTGDTLPLPNAKGVEPTQPGELTQPEQPTQSEQVKQPEQ